MMNFDKLTAIQTCIRNDIRAIEELEHHLAKLREMEHEEQLRLAAEFEGLEPEKVDLQKEFEPKYEFIEGEQPW